MFEEKIEKRMQPGFPNFRIQRGSEEQRLNHLRTAKKRRVEQKHAEEAAAKRGVLQMHAEAAEDATKHKGKLTN